jgi:toxin-antitoxin system PIN domain toxin
VQASLFDTNVWLALTFPKHRHHHLAQKALEHATAKQPAVFCRSTQQSVLRLMSTAGIARTYDVPHLTNRDAWLTLDALQALPQVAWRDESPGLLPHWRNLAALDTSSPKVWMDAYLAAFAIAGGLRLVTLDSDFKNFESQGLKLTLLAP